MLLVQPVQYTDSNSHRSTVLTVALSTTTVNTSYHRPRGSETISPPPAIGVEWNDLPSDVMTASSLSVFKNRLKTYLFHHCYEAG